MNRVQSAAILAGGLSSRMGREKALLEVGDEPLIRRTVRTLQPLFERVVVVTNSDEVARVADVPCIRDRHTHKGPLGGIEAVLSHFGEPAFVVACDLPFLSAELIRFHCGKWRPELDALVAESESGIEPLHAVWSQSALGMVRKFLGEERPPSLRRVLRELNVGSISIKEAHRFDATLRCFENWNTPEDVKD